MIHKSDGTRTISNCGGNKGANVFIKIFILFIYLVIYKFEDWEHLLLKIRNGLERWVSTEEHLLLLQRSQAEFLAPAWWLTAICNYHSRGSGALL